MRNLHLPLLIFFVLLIPSIAAGQDYNIKGDTIRISSSVFPRLIFMGEIQEYQPLCPGYRLVPTTTTIIIKPDASKPPPVCGIIVAEGSKKSPRQHQFVLIFDKNADPAEQTYDYSTKDLIEKRVQYLEKMRGAASAGASKVARQVGKKGLFSRDPKKEAIKNDVIEEKEVTNLVKQTAGIDSEETADEEAEPAKQPKESSKAVTEISGIPTKLIEDRVELKIKTFYKVCELLCAGKDVDNTIDYGMKYLFDYNEEAVVETTNSKNNTKGSKKIRQYFNHLSQLKYRSVKMTAYDIKFVSKFYLGPDKQWHASAVIMQDFKGYKDNILTYKDVTNKTIDIIIKTFEVVKDGVPVTQFDIYLGDISVTNVAS